MNKLNVLTKISQCGVVAVLRADSVEEAVRMSEACIEGGILGIEITFTIQDADAVIKQLASIYSDRGDVVIGAGTVLDAATARIAILAGAQYIVSPSFDEETAKLCNLYQIPYMPGCMTITEMKRALEFGVDIVKLFPGSAFGSDFVKAVKAPLPQVNIMPTGGVDVDKENLSGWFKAGVCAVGMGSKLISKPLMEAKDYGKIESLTKEVMATIQSVRS